MGTLKGTSMRFYRTTCMRCPRSMESPHFTLDDHEGELIERGWDTELDSEERVLWKCPGCRAEERNL